MLVDEILKKDFGDLFNYIKNVRACTAEPMGCITTWLNTTALDSNLCRIAHARHWVSNVPGVRL